MRNYCSFSVITIFTWFVVSELSGCQSTVANPDLINAFVKTETKAFEVVEKNERPIKPEVARKANGLLVRSEASRGIFLKCGETQSVGIGCRIRTAHPLLAEIEEIPRATIYASL